ncbi:MAG TPA: hypothetical protein VHJ76_04585, partial [Actinomycetota bacterium]|nr:hypothetical protein [Actinomycetota bacterium]
MRRTLTLLLAIVSGTMLGVVPATTAAADRSQAPESALMSDNVELLTTLPNPGVIGARFRDGLMYATTATGLTVYDVSDPRAPQEVGRLPLPHFENEDVDLGGDILLISNDAAESTGILYVIDISDPAAPAILTTFPMGGNPVEGGPGHTASCLLDCTFAWVTDGAGIKVIDLRDPAAPVDMGTFETPAGGDIATHDVQVDQQGLAWVVGFGGAVAYRLPAGYDGNDLGHAVVKTDPTGNSTYLDELGIGPGDQPNDYILHNSMRAKRGVVYVTEEDYTRPGCRGAGSFETWKLPLRADGTPNGEDMTLLDAWETELLADTANAAAMCSAHYFDYRDNVVAQGWYEQGVRLLDVSKPKAIRQVGYFVPPSAMTWAAYFPPTDRSGRVLYVLDATHGIDVLEFDRPARGPLSASGKACTAP